jgi:hypothetical protein
VLKRKDTKWEDRQKKHHPFCMPAYSLFAKENTNDAQSIVFSFLGESGYVIAYVRLMEWSTADQSCPM